MRDELFKRKKNVPMSKEEIRYISLGYLELHSAQRLLDVGSGTGSISLEVALMNPSIHVIGIECDKEAFDLSLENKSLLENKAFTVDQNLLEHDHSSDYTGCHFKNLKFIFAQAPTEKVTGKFDRIFIGGTKGNPEDIISWAYDLLTEEGILVMNFITLENFQSSINKINSIAGFSKLEGSMCSINRLSDLGPYTYFKGYNPTFIIKTIKRSK